MGDLQKRLTKPGTVLIVLLSIFVFSACDNYPREPFKVRDRIILKDEMLAKKVIATVPEGKRLVIESISIIGQSQQDAKPRWNEILVKTKPGPTPGPANFFTTVNLSLNQAGSAQRWYFNGHEQVRMYAGPGDEIQIGFGLAAKPTQTTPIDFTLWGYYVPVDSPRLGP